MLTSAGLSEKAQLTAKFIRRKKAEHDALMEDIEVLERELQVSACTVTLDKKIWNNLEKT